MATARTEDYDMPALPSPRKARANFAYTADEPNELTFNEGDIITVDKMDPSGWWHGMVSEISMEFRSVGMTWRRWGLGADFFQETTVICLRRRLRMSGK